MELEIVLELQNTF